MIILYEPNATVFTNNGIKVINNAISCFVKREGHKLYEFELVVPTVQNEEIKLESILRIPTPSSRGWQLFRVRDVERDGKITRFTGSHIFWDCDSVYDLRDVSTTFQTNAETELFGHIFALDNSFTFQRPGTQYLSPGYRGYSEELAVEYKKSSGMEYASLLNNLLGSASKTSMTWENQEKIPPEAAQMKGSGGWFEATFPQETLFFDFDNKQVTVYNYETLIFQPKAQHFFSYEKNIENLKYYCETGLPVSAINISINKTFVSKVVNSYYPFIKKNELVWEFDEAFAPSVIDAANIFLGNTPTTPALNIEIDIIPDTLKKVDVYDKITLTSFEKQPAIQYAQGSPIDEKQDFLISSYEYDALKGINTRITIGDLKRSYSAEENRISSGNIILASNVINDTFSRTNKTLG